MPQKCNVSNHGISPGLCYFHHGHQDNQTTTLTLQSPKTFKVAAAITFLCCCLHVYIVTQCIPWFLLVYQQTISLSYLTGTIAR